MNYKKHIASKIKIDGLSEKQIEDFIINTVDNNFGDYSFPCFKLSSILRKSPVMIANDLASKISTDEYIEKIESVNGYLNFTINRKNFAFDVLGNILNKNESYGSSNVGNGKNIVIDYSSINIAKPFHIGHLSTTVIGGALYRIYKFLGYNVIGVNHLGDYGTQFGKLIYAYKTWGNKETVEQNGIKELTRLYVLYHEEAEKDPSIDDVAREYFKKIENGDSECVQLFKWFKELTLKDVVKIYDKLDVKFDSYNGESFYFDKMDVVIDELKEKNLLVESDGAKIVDLSAYDMPPLLILRSDGASLYATRDLAAAYYRNKTYDFTKCLYVVAYQQNLHFKQLFKVLDLLGKPFAKDMEHVAFGMVSLEDGTMSTRKGKVVLLEDVINKCVEKAYSIINEKNPSLEDKQSVAEAVGTGAVIFGALINSRIKDIVFSYDKVLNFEGETAPYVQYTYARCVSLLQKAGNNLGEYKVDNLLKQEYDLISMLAKFEDVVLSSAEKNEPSLVTRYAVDVASLFNKFYFDCKILGEEENVKNFRLAITLATKTVIKNALSLLGIKTPQKM